LDTFRLKFTINANIVYIPVETTFKTSMVCHNHLVPEMTLYRVGR